MQVPWYTVPDLVSTRRVYITGGNAYVPQAYQISLVLQAFRERLGKALEVSLRLAHLVMIDSTLTHCYIGMTGHGQVFTPNGRGRPSHAHPLSSLPLVPHEYLLDG